MVLAIVGSREFDDYDLLCKEIVPLIDTYSVTKIISGCAKGADALAEMFAAENGIDFEKFSANWKLYKKVAGVMRNSLIAENCDILVAFWDGKSKGTLDTIKKTRKFNKEVKIINF